MLSTFYDCVWCSAVSALYLSLLFFFLCVLFVSLCLHLISVSLCLSLFVCLLFYVSFLPLSLICLFFSVSVASVYNCLYIFFVFVCLQLTLNPNYFFLGDLAAYVVKAFFRLWRTNCLLPVELLFSKQRAPQTLVSCRAPSSAAAAAAAAGGGEAGGDAEAAAAAAAAAEDAAMTQQDFWCPASLPALQSLSSNYSRGIDAKVQQQLQQLPHLEPQDALRVAAEEAAAANGRHRDSTAA